MYRFVFVNGGRYYGRVATPAKGTSYAFQKALKARAGARTLTLLKPDGKDYQGWLARVPAADWP